MDILLLLGLTIFLGTLSGKLCHKLKIPQVTGFIITGLILGKSFLHLWDQTSIDLLSPVTNLALGIIGFMIGSELKLEVFQKRGGSIYSILVGEVFVTFIAVCACVTLITQKFYLGLLFGALAAATAPAATVDVLWEYKSRGPLTSTVLAIVALDDALALIIYGFAGAFAKSLIGHEQFSILHSFEAPFIEIGSAVIIGVVGGYVLYWLNHYVVKDRDRVLPFTIGAIVLTVGAATTFKADLILCNMLVGMTFVNLAPVESKEIFDMVKRFSSPITILFFALVGARLDVFLLLGSGAAVLVVVYFLSRSFGKIAGSYIGGRIGQAPFVVSRYLGFCLFSQAGVAIGMAISIYNNLSHLGTEASQIGLLIINVIVASTFIVQIIGPIMLRFAVDKAGEIGRDVTEEDIIDSYKVEDIMERDVPVIKKNTPLYSLIETIKESETESYHFCVVDDQQQLLGVISLGDLKETFMRQEMELNRLVLAEDIAVPSTRVIAASKPLKEAIDIFRLKNLEYLPVVKNEESRQLVGILHDWYARKQVQKELVQKRGS